MTGYNVDTWSACELSRDNFLLQWSASILKLLIKYHYHYLNGRYVVLDGEVPSLSELLYD
jgi:hypothetical protein